MVDLIVDLVGAAIVAAFAAIALARVERVQFIRLFADPSSSRGSGDFTDDRTDPVEER